MKLKALPKQRSTFIAIGMVIMLAFFSCTYAPTEVAEKPYFDLTSFLTEQINLLQKDSLVVMKTSAINTKTEQHQMNWTDWKRELALFLASDINKASLIGKYAVDTLYTPGGTDNAEIRIQYKARDSSLHTRLLEVTLNAHEVKEIHIINKTSGFLSSASENLLYQPMKAYLIRTSEQNRFFGRNDFSVMGEITTKRKKYF